VLRKQARNFIEGRYFEFCGLVRDLRLTVCGTADATSIVAPTLRRRSLRRGRYRALGDQVRHPKQLLIASVLAYYIFPRTDVTRRHRDVKRFVYLLC